MPPQVFELITGWLVEGGNGLPGLLGLPGRKRAVVVVIMVDDGLPGMALASGRKSIYE
jgi:hypothetical protein